MEKAGKIKIIVDKKKGADGREFFAAGIRGKYIPKDLAKVLGAEEDRYYAIRPVGVSLPQKKGVWPSRSPIAGSTRESRNSRSSVSAILPSISRRSFSRRLSRLTSTTLPNNI